MNTTSTFGKLYLIPCTLSNPGEVSVDPNDVLPQTIKRCIELLDYYIVEMKKRLENVSKQFAQKNRNLVYNYGL
jgi:16S rRNA (cytidine1402-2'-O)-methyltransferase